MQSEPILQYLFARKDILQNSLSKNPLQIVQARQAEDAKRARRAKEEKSRRGKEEKLLQAEDAKLLQAEDAKLLQAEDAKLLQAVEEKRARRAKEEKSRRGKEEKSRQAEEEKSPQGEEENSRQVNLLRQENENENEREHNSRAVQQRSVDWDSPVFSNDRAKNLTVVRQWLAEQSSPSSKRCPGSHTSSSVFSVPTRPQSLSEEAKVQKEKAPRLKVDQTTKKESRSLNSTSIFWLFLGAFIAARS